jgi:dipeptidyl aminopeptidase/acylaminoacyl peptidase
VYPGEGHRIREPQHRRDITARTLAWFNRYLASAGP